MWSTSSEQEGEEGGGRGRRGGKEKRDGEEVEGDEYKEGSTSTCVALVSVNDIFWDGVTLGFESLNQIAKGVCE